ncbi:MAG: hypothetical protein ACR2PG_04050 [Hyphomicrobiaceae bacterium]
MWSQRRREERAASYDVPPDELDSNDRDRSLPKESVYPEDIAEGIYFFAYYRTRKSTANVLDIDAGNAQSIPRQLSGYFCHAHLVFNELVDAAANRLNDSRQLHICSINHPT